MDLVMSTFAESSLMESIQLFQVEKHRHQAVLTVMAALRHLSSAISSEVPCISTRSRDLL